MKKLMKISIKVLIATTCSVLTVSCDNQSKRKEQYTEFYERKDVLKEMERLEKERKVQITDEMIEEHIKNDPVLMNDIKREAENQAKKVVDEKILNAPLEVFFKNSPQQLESYKLCVSELPTQSNREDLLIMINMCIEEINNAINTIKNKKEGSNIVPKSLKKLLLDLKENEKRVREFQMEK